jgi:hypothetical protein
MVVRAATPISSGPATISAGRAVFEFFVLLPDVREEVFAKLLALEDHSLIGTTRKHVSKGRQIQCQ